MLLLWWLCDVEANASHSDGAHDSTGAPKAYLGGGNWAVLKKVNDAIAHCLAMDARVRKFLPLRCRSIPRVVRVASDTLASSCHVLTCDDGVKTLRTAANVQHNGLHTGGEERDVHV